MLGNSSKNKTETKGSDKGKNRPPVCFQLTLGKVFAMVSLRKKYIKVVGALRGE
jgi:hypothetical protein